MTTQFDQNGFPLMPGATIVNGGVNFSLYSRDAERVVLYFFDAPDSKTASSTFEFDSKKNKTGDMWHAFIPGLKAGALYLYKIDGPYNPPAGQRFNFHKFLFDPYAKAFTSGSVFKSYNALHKSGFASNSDGELQDLSNFPKCVVVDDKFDWEGDKPLNYALENSVIYETHLKGFTASKTSGVPAKIAGTYKGFCKKIDYIKIF